MNNNLEQYRIRLSELGHQLEDPAIFSTPQKLSEVSREYNQVKEIVDKLDKIKNLGEKIRETEKIAESEKDPEILNLAREEIKKMETEKNEIQNEIKMALSPKNKLARKNVIMEIRAGTGGEEAALFAANLFQMYSHFAEKKGWQTEILDSNRTDLGGFKEITFRIVGLDAYKNLQSESGVHRVQRIPKTEKTGRIHTSTATVAVLPEAEEIDFKINPQDLKIDTFRSSGKGGQNVQKVESAVRITHLPTGLVVSCQDERFQQRNKDKALKILRSRLFLMEEEKRQREIETSRRTQIGQAKRAEKIRTYNFPQDRLTDHRLQKSWHNLPEIMNGNLDPIIEAFNK